MTKITINFLSLVRNSQKLDLSQATITAPDTDPNHPIPHLTDGSPDTFYSSGSDVGSESWIKVDFKADHFNFGIVEVVNRRSTGGYVCNTLCQRRLENTRVEVLQFETVVRNCGTIVGRF